MNYKEYKEENGGIIVAAIKEIIKEEGLDVKCSVHSLVHQRFYLMWYLRKHTKLSLQSVGHLFNKKHDRVLHSINRHHTFLETKDCVYRENVENVKNYLYLKFPLLV